MLLLSSYVYACFGVTRMLIDGYQVVQVVSLDQSVLDIIVIGSGPVGFSSVKK